MTAPAPSKGFEPSETPLTLLFPDIEHEFRTTKRMLERVPDGQDDWRPHVKSMTLGQLATHVAVLPGLGILMLTKDEFDGATRSPDPTFSVGADRVKMFEDLSAQLRGLLQQLTWENARVVWALKFHERVVMEAPRAQMFRISIITHIAHHRAQLGVYLRMLGVPVPGSYGPTADEPLAPR